MDVVTWNKKDATYYDRGRKAYSFGDVIPKKALETMGEETFKEYKENGLLKVGLTVIEEVAEEVFLETVQVTTQPEPDGVDETDTVIKLEPTIDDLREKAVALGLKPHHNAGAEKLQQMIDDKEKIDLSL